MPITHPAMEVQHESGSELFAGRSVALIAIFVASILAAGWTLSRGSFLNSKTQSAMNALGVEKIFSQRTNKKDSDRILTGYRLIAPRQSRAAALKESLRARREMLRKERVQPIIP